MTLEDAKKVAELICIATESDDLEPSSWVRELVMKANDTWPEFSFVVTRKPVTIDVHPYEDIPDYIEERECLAVLVWRANDSEATA